MCSGVSDSLGHHGLQPARLHCPWNFPDKNTGVGRHFLLQGIFLTQGLNLRLMRWQVGSWPLSHLGSSWATQVASYILVATLKKEEGTDPDDTNSNVSRQYIQNIISTYNQYRKELIYAPSLKSGVYFCSTSQFRWWIFIRNTRPLFRFHETQHLKKSIPIPTLSQWCWIVFQ